MVVEEWMYVGVIVEINVESESIMVMMIVKVWSYMV